MNDLSTEIGRPLNGEVLSNTRRQAVAHFTREIPTNDYGLPKFLYRTDMIPHDLLAKPRDYQERILSAAVIQINYDEGFPAFDNADAIWAQMPFEDTSSYALFANYVELQDKAGVRQVASMVEVSGVDQETLLDYFHLYYWRIRAKAYDMFKVAVHEKQRLRRLMQCEDDHYVMAANMLKKCAEYFENKDFSELDPSVVARMLPQMADLQRKALGGGSPTSDGRGNGSGAGTSLEVILRQISGGEVADGSGQFKGDADTIQTLLDNPEAAEAAQELIVRLHNKNA